MVENCTVYLPTTMVDFESFLPNGTTDLDADNIPASYEYEAAEGPVRLTINYASDDPDHLDGLGGYISQLDNSDADVKEALDRVDQTELFLGVILPQPVPDDSETFQSLVTLANELDGFMFVSDSILIADGFLVGPMTYAKDFASEHFDGDAAGQYPIDDAVGDTPLDHEAEPEKLDPDIAPADKATEPSAQLVAIREQNVALLASRGFICAAGLPLGRPGESFGRLRPGIEIAQRLMAQFALFMWVAATEDKAETDGIEQFIVSNDLSPAYTERELVILETPRDQANAELGGTIGWSLENMWALCWVFGFEPEPSFQSGQIPTDTTNSILSFMPNLGETIGGFMGKNPCRSEQGIAKKEDLFYCAHNAVRSAQLGEPAVPEDFDPVADGGAIHERRHALTWCLSPGVNWEDTDLST